MADLAIMGVPLLALIGFCFAAYAIVANDVIQTLGTFLASNAKRPWVVLWAFASTIIIGVMLYGYFGYDGDIAFDRLNSIPFPEDGVQWYHVLPPLVLLILTRFGIPVSTTFLVLTIFTLTGGAATAGVLGSMLVKSLLGYLVAFGAGAVLFFIIARMFERWVAKTDVDTEHSPPWAIPGVAALTGLLVYLLVAGPTLPDIENANWTAVAITAVASIAIAFITNRFNTWYVLQWLSTGFLWSQWLMQDLANIFVYLPRETAVVNGEIQVTFSIGLLIFATLLMVGLHAIIFAIRGGEIQKIVLSKTNTTDVRAATVVDFVFGIILMYFKEINDIPMSTTWVFLGLLAGRELAISFISGLRQKGEAIFDVVTDAVRAGIGLIVSVTMALVLPFFAYGEFPDLGQALFGGGDTAAIEQPVDAGRSGLGR
ncbi:MAG: hypothetical protein NXI12_09360 [Alphaproteobacteria bacterium]|nr:hypothetical protein [Alphaproteobacteria bacterium]